MHEMLLLIDKEFKHFTKDRMKWDEAIQQQINKYYHDNSFCDYAVVGGRFCKALECKPGTGLVNPYVGDWDGKYDKDDQIYDKHATKVDVCTIGNMTKPFNDEWLSYIEWTDPCSSTLRECDDEFYSVIEQINNKEFDGLLVILDIHV